MADYIFSEITGRLTAQEKELANAAVSAGFISTPVFTDLTNGQCIVDAASCLLYDNAENLGSLKEYLVADATFTLTEGITSYIVVNYNGGSPVYQVTTDVNIINESDIIPVFTCYNENNLIIHKIDWDLLGTGVPNKLNMRLVKTQRFGHESGLALGEDGTNRYVTISEGKVWTGAARHELQAFDSNIHRWLFWEYNGATWTKTVTTSAGVYNNTQYQGPTGLVTLQPNQFGVVWIFRDADNDPHAGYILGNDSYGTVADAAQAPLPSLIPGEFSAHGILIGRIIVEKGSDTAAQIDSAFENPITNSPVTVHNNLSGINGGSPYYHSDQPISTTDDVGFNSIDSTTSITANTYVKGGQSWILLEPGGGGGLYFIGNDVDMNQRFMVNTSVGIQTITCAVIPKIGQMITVFDELGTFNTNPTTVNLQNGLFERAAGPTAVELNVANSYSEFVYVGGSIGWKLISFVAS